MGLRERVMGWLDRGAPPAEPAPDTPVEVEDVWLHEGPMLLRVLEQAGIPAQGVEAFRYPVSVRDRMRIIVRYADAPRAIEVIEAHRRRLR